jgi:predicted DNA-binding transcriptional regulator YafY
VGKSPAKLVNQRSEDLVALLKSRDAWTTTELSRELRVSHRTLMRDLETLRDRGYPLEADRGRGGGIRLQRNWSIGRFTLDYREALDLLFSLAVMERMRSPLLLNHLASIRTKLAASFSAINRKRILLLRKRIMVGEAISSTVAASYGPCVPDCLEKVHEAFFEMRLLHIQYEDEKGQGSTRMIEPQFLHYCAPVWYVLAWDLQSNDSRTFRIDRIRSAVVQKTAFSARREELFLKAIAHFSSSL